MLEETRIRRVEGESLRSIARSFNVDESSLRARLKRGYGVKSLGRFKKTFSDEQEHELAQHCKEMEQRFYGVTKKMFRQIAYQFAEENGINHKFNSHKKLAGNDWAQTFFKKYNLSLRTPQKTSLARIMGFNKTQVDQFYNNLTNLMSVHKFPPSRIYNMDESGITTVPNKIPKVIAAKGKRMVNKVTSAEREQLITAVCCFSATGHYVPPALIFPRKRTKPSLMVGASSDSILFVSDSGYINSDLFIEYLKHFHKHVKSNKDSPTLLILDNHSSHCTLEALKFCRENNIHLLSIPPHSSHKTQPLDRCFFKSLKDYYGEYCDQWLINHPGCTIGQDNIAAIFGQAYHKACTMEKAVNAFKVCGIVPVNKFLFNEEDFLPSTVTDQNMPHENENLPQPENGQNLNLRPDSSSSDDDLPLTRFIRKKQHFTGPENPAPSTSTADSPQPSTSKLEHQFIFPEDPTPSTAGSPQPSTSKLKHKSSCADDSAPPTLHADTAKPSTSKPKYKSPKDLFPYPKITKERKRTRKGKKSTIMTSTPNKEELENERKLQLEKQIKKDAKNFLKKRKSSLKELQDVEDTQGKKDSKIDIFCPGCEEIYEDPPQEDWIQCARCFSWWHETCSNYETGGFLCDICC